MYYIFVIEGHSTGTVTVRKGRKTQSKLKALEQLKALHEGEVRDEHNNLVALKARGHLHVVDDLFKQAADRAGVNF